MGKKVIDKTDSKEYKKLTKIIQDICKHCHAHVWWATRKVAMCHVYDTPTPIPKSAEKLMTVCPLVDSILDRIKNKEGLLW